MDLMNFNFRARRTTSDLHVRVGMVLCFDDKMRLLERMIATRSTFKEFKTSALFDYRCKTVWPSTITCTDVFMDAVTMSMQTG